METIEKATGKKIIRVETSDLDEMEDVSNSYLTGSDIVLMTICAFSANEEGIEVDDAIRRFVLSWNDVYYLIPDFPSAFALCISA